MFLTWPWWIMGGFLALFILDVILLESEKEGWASLWMVLGSMGLVWLATGIFPLSLLWTNLGGFIAFCLTYTGIGIGWSFLKWYFYLLKVRDKAREMSNLGKPMVRPEESYARNNKARIASWIWHWPMSIIATFFGDWLVRLTDAFFEWFGHMYGNIGNRMFDGEFARTEEEASERALGKKS